MDISVQFQPDGTDGAKSRPGHYLATLWYCYNEDDLSVTLDFHPPPLPVPPHYSETLSPFRSFRPERWMEVPQAHRFPLGLIILISVIN